jgi:hypothetical protein
MSNRSVGTNTPQQNREEISFSPTEGWSGQWTVEGPKAGVKAILNQLAAQGLSFRYTSDQSPHAQVVFGNPGEVLPGVGEVPQTVWEVFGGGGEIDILEADVTACNALSDEERRTIREAINSPVEGQSPALTTSEAIGVYKVMLSGVRSFRVNVPSLRVSKVVSGNYGVVASLTNVGRVISTGTLRIQEAVPNTLLVNLPAYTSGKTDFGYGWYKNHPTVQQVGGNKYNVNQQWDFGIWPTLLYGAIL